MQGYRFAHTTDTTTAGFVTPLWIVGESPFQDVQTDSEGYVVHLGEPRFVARWWAGNEPPDNVSNPIRGLTCSAHGVELCEVVWLDSPADEAGPWLIEACAAVAAYLGEIAIVESA